MKKTAVLLLLFFSFGAYAQPEPDSVFEKINARLNLMVEIGLYKAIHHMPVEDIARGEEVIRKATESARSYGIKGSTVVGFFTAQIAAGKAIQYRYRADLLTQPSERIPRDLIHEIRPELIRLGEEINEAIASYLKAGGAFQDQHRARFDQFIQQQYLTPSDKQNLFTSLQLIRLKR